MSIADAPSKPFVFGERSTAVVGRDDRCDIPAPARERQVSRQHCAFDIEPPMVRVRDLGSRNGTYVNDVRITGPDSQTYELTDGDVVRAGTMRLRVTITGTMHSTPDNDDLLLHGEQVGQYTVVREIGRGAQGIVYLGRHQDTGQSVALKVLWPQPGALPGAVHAFRREIENISALRHPNLLRFREAGSTGALFFFASEYCAGGSLVERVNGQGGPLTPDDSVAITLQVLNGLAYAHSVPLPAVRNSDGTMAPARGLVHRDISPQNLLLSDAGPAPVVKIADFGLAKAFERAGLSGLTHSEASGGSAAFIPRAQIVNFKYAEPAVDVWATAACLYWMLTHKYPRDFPDGIDPALVVWREPVVPIRDRNASLPTGLGTAIDDVLAEEDPRDGVIPSAEEFKRALEDALQAGPDLSRTSGSRTDNGL
ncbi:protein kinase [Streptomyces globisporus]|uniref:protein kinase domain-containing protein n=1 Tax=Streptomyces TaxID=1883 RepID=UPI0018E9EC7E|nr:FHA domain-containing serine/threonine-protein kinase [Streptomyces sp. TSRI0445]